MTFSQQEQPERFTPPVHAKPIKIVADGKKTIRSRLFERRDQAATQGTDTRANVQARAQNQTTHQVYNQNDSFNYNPLRPNSNPVPSAHQQQYPVQQVAYFQDDGSNWRRRGSTAIPASQQLQGETELKGPMQDDWNSQAPFPPYEQEIDSTRNSGPTPAEPINDPFGDSVLSNELSEVQSPTPARQIPPRRLPGYSTPNNSNLDYGHQYQQPRRVEPRYMHPRDERSQNRIQGYPSGYRQDDEDDDLLAIEDDGDDELQGGRGIRSCEEYRNELLNNPITEIICDISPKRSVNPSDDMVAEVGRNWTDRCGNPLGTGTLVGLRRSYAVIANEHGQHQQLRLATLSDADLASISAYWDIPVECTTGCHIYHGRCWQPQTVTWYASNLCHKPLYFEDIQLERYGHSAGPLAQPIRSTAHFFKSLIMFPYNKGIHPPNECIYALGYYRPGNCAPWLVDPFPYSLAGAYHMSSFYSGAAFIFP